ncbi:unnamed protein product [Brassica oleracea var. botrytis]|uniref:(rape) hypothetical protein n=1 Tax=Brassica napus TaxID=3708 RepID=A0A816IS92_BRANA|nr:unnamed protein product [Brassica napus]
MIYSVQFRSFSSIRNNRRTEMREITTFCLCFWATPAWVLKPVMLPRWICHI